MNAGALRALEFDRIVDGRAELRAHADRTRTPRRAAARRWTRARWPTRRPPRPRRSRYLENQPVFPLRAPEDLDEVLGAARDRGARARAAAAAGAGACISSRSSRPAQAVRRASGHFPRLTAIVERVGAVPRRDRRPSATRSVRPARCSITPARRCRACAIGCASSAPASARRSSRTCAARTRRSTCRSRSSPSATAAT